jgi:hypothetical protein
MQYLLSVVFVGNFFYQQFSTKVLRREVKQQHLIR